jgi:2-methylcitrate dehydratase PrpD
VTTNLSPPPGTISSRVADYVLGLRLDDVTADVRHFAKLLLLDCLGCIVSGALTPSGRAAVALAETAPLPQARVAGSGARVAVERAALANAICCNALDFEPVGPEGHVGALAVPAVLAVADWRESSGAEVLRALIAGLDVSGRIGAAWRRITPGAAVVGLPPVRGGPHGIFAAVVPAAMLLGLAHGEIRDALGIASYSAHVPTLRKVLETDEPPMTKYDHIGGMTLAGIDAARLAALGFTGDRDAFEGEFGAWRYSGGLDCDWSLLEEFGGDFMIAPTFFKPAPCNLYDCSVVVLVERIVAAQRLRPDEITHLLLQPSREIKGHYGDGSGGPIAQWLSLRLNAAHGACGTRPYSRWQDGEPPLPSP